MENDKKARINSQTRIIILGAGPAGLAAAYELIKTTDAKPMLLEANSRVGGLAKTLDYRGWRFDIGPHRFFSKSLEINQIWENLLPIKDVAENTDRSLLLKNRSTRIYHNKRFFDYPIKLTFKNLKNFSPLTILIIIKDYILIRVKPIKPEISLEDFFINRFGSKLYSLFFRDYTEKVWGVPCAEIPKAWGAQRIKKLSIGKILSEAIKNIFKPKRATQETSLIDRFLYPKLGAGQMYEAMAEEIKRQGGLIKTDCQVTSINIQNNKIISVLVWDKETKTQIKYEGDYFISSLPIKDLVSMSDSAPAEIKEIGQGLGYRDFILVTLLYSKITTPIPDQWIYIQESGLKMGRLDIFNNFSPRLLKDQDKVWLGAEYFCNEDDDFWTKSDEEIITFAKAELAQAGIADTEESLDGHVYRQTKAYPAYLGSYDKFPQVRAYLDSIYNLYPVGRNGQHRYNNMDHSMLTGLEAARAIINNSEKEKLWSINTEDSYHESK